MKTGRKRPCGVQLYLDVGGVAPTLLPVDVQPEQLAHLADLGSVLGEVGPRRLAPLPLLHISCQVVQQLCERTQAARELQHNSIHMTHGERLFKSRTH